MKKIFSFMIAAIIAVMSMNAQIAFEQPRFVDNTYLRLEGGVTGLTDPSALGYENFGHTLQTVIGAEVGKWVTPNFGVAFEGDFGIRNGSKLAYFGYEANGKRAQKFNYITVTGLVKGNLTNLFGGYRTDRRWEVVLATGPMWIHGYPGKQYENDFGVKFKAEINYNINSRWQVNFIPEFNYNLTGLYSYGTYEHPRFDKRNSWVALKAGVTYKFGNTFKVSDKKYTQVQWDALNAEVNTLRAQQPQVVEKVVEKVVERTVTEQTVYVVAFDYGKSTLDVTARTVLETIPTNATVVVKGEASYPGSEQFNQKLSETRAQVVADYLKGRGVSVADTQGLGETGHQVVTVYVK